MQKHAAAGGGAAEGLSTYVEALDDLGGVAVLEKLMNHANVDIYSRVVSGKCWVLLGTLLLAEGRTCTDHPPLRSCVCLRHILKSTTIMMMMMMLMMQVLR